MRFRSTVLLFLKGLFMGVADLIPGVSGGTLAFILGIYQNLIHALQQAVKGVSLILRLKFAEGWAKINFQFLLPLFFGIALAFLAFSHLISLALEKIPGITFAFFFGLILASAVPLYSHIEKIKLEHIILLIIGIAISYSVAGATTASSVHGPGLIFLAGILAICAMLLPGISGSFVLLLLGQYAFLLQALHSLQWPIIFLFIFGALVGLILSTKLIDYLLQKWKSFTIVFLLGIMLGALRVPWTVMADSSSSWWLLAVVAIIGATLVLLLHRRQQN